MKAFVVVCILLVAVQAMTEEQKQKMEQLSKECLEISKVDESLIKDAEMGKFADDPKLKIHALCMSKKFNLQNEDGELQIEDFKQKLNAQQKPKEEVEKVAKLCMVRRDTPENTAFEMFQCLQKNKVVLV